MTAPSPTDSENRQWFVLSVAFGRELTLMSRLQEKAGIRCFVPMRRERKRNANGRFYYKRSIAIPNYVFAHASARLLKAAVGTPGTALGHANFVRRDDKEGRRVPVTVPQNEMESFIAIAGNEEERVLFLNPSELDFTKGERVRIIGGPFEGVEGTFMKVSKKHEKRVVVKIEGISAVATTALPSVLVRKL